MIREGSTVTWKWGRGTATGKVKATFDHEVNTTIKGTNVTRKGKPGNKALLIQQENGAEVLKLESEVEKTD
ncbi:hypervirulence associated TUDOR domain-containing protein [Salinimicrobium gaetbulicola]|uniref:DUF2945 domain-containing protein n=1 Tax=Salinimicrobium gaetbulicola TaxID=999702 RepID=A0ABW3IDS3_9FLAO